MGTVEFILIIKKKEKITLLDYTSWLFDEVRTKLNRLTNLVFYMEFLLIPIRNI